MSEEEIIDEIKYNILNDPFIVFSQDSSYEDVQIKATAIQGLLDLYNKEKQKNKKYQGIENGTTIIYKSKAKYVREDRIEKYYINKNKIREFIKKETKQDTYNFDCISAKKLEELLEEE